MNWQLTEGAIDTLLTGGSVTCPVIQILGCKKIPNEERYRLLVSDGHHMSSSVVLSEKLNDKLTSGELSNYCVVRVDQFVVSNNVEVEEENHLLTILELTILAKGQEVKRKIGKLVSFTEGECDPTAVAPVNMNCQLTEGALDTILTGGYVKCPVIQILGSKIIGNIGGERYRLRVSDGRHVYSFVMIAHNLNDGMTSGEVSDYSVVRVDRWIVSKVLWDRTRGYSLVLVILAWTVLAKGEEVKGKIGQPVLHATEVRDPSAVVQPEVAPVQPVVAPEHAAVNTSSILTEGAIATLLTGGSVTCPVLQILGSKKICGTGRERYRLLVSDGRYLNSFAMLSVSLNDRVTSGQLSDYSVVRMDKLVVSEVRAEQKRNVMVILKLTTLAKGAEVRRKIGQPVPFPEREGVPPAVAQPVVAPENVDWQAMLQRRITPQNATFACAYLRRAVALPPEQLRRVLIGIGRWPSFPVYELFRCVADLPAVQMRAVVRRLTAILSLRASKRRAAAA